VDPSVAAAWIALAAAVIYTLATGARVSTVRALVVVTIVLLGIATCRRARFIDALGLAVIVLIAFDPGVVFEVSFQLSFAATATLALVSRRAAPAPEAVDRARWRRVVRVVSGRVWQLLAASMWTSLATAPFTAVAFHRVAGGGLVANVIVVPLVELVVLPLTLLGALLAVVWDGLGGALIDLAVVAAGAAADVAGLAAEVWPSTRVPPPNWIELCAAFALWLAAVSLARGALVRRRGAIIIAASLAAIAASWIVTAHLAPARSRSLEVTFLDVGQGDAAVVRLPGGAVWLIDAGGLPSVPSRLDRATRERLGELPGTRSVVPFLEHERVRVIDRVVLSHPHPDHYRGLRAVARAFPIRELWVAADGEDQPVSDPEYRQLLADLRARGTRIVHPALDTATVDHGVRLTALAPRFEGERATTDPVVSINDDSLVVRVEYRGRALLFAGDLEVEGEATLARRNVSADVVKVAHHGSGTSSSPPFVAAVAPRFAVISCGVANQFGFPASSVLARWEGAGARVLRTDVHGSITVVIAEDGGLSVETVD
jgi:competence protein ComEC